MSNASSCRRAAAHFADLADHAEMAEQAEAYRELERLWLEMAGLAERFDREHDDDAKAAIYAMMREVEAVARKVA